MEEFSRFTITVTALDDQDYEVAQALVRADTSRGDPRFAGLHFTSADPDVDVFRLWGSVDWHGMVALLPKGGTIYEPPALPPADQPELKAAPAEQRIVSAVEVAADLREKINNGTYPPGYQFPTRDKLLREYPWASTWALKQAMVTLVAEGLVVSERANGTRVRGPATAPEKPAAPAEPTAAPSAPKKRLATTGRPSPPHEELFEILEQAGSIRGLADHYGVPYHTAHGWLQRAERDRHLRSLPIVDPAAREA